MTGNSAIGYWQRLRAHNPANRLVVIRMLPNTARRARICAPYALGVAYAVQSANGRRPVKGTGWAVDNEFLAEKPARKADTEMLT